jgi:hypothetical protein
VIGFPSDVLRKILYAFLISPYVLQCYIFRPKRQPLFFQPKNELTWVRRRNAKPASLRHVRCRLRTLQNVKNLNTTLKSRNEFYDKLERLILKMRVIIQFEDLYIRNNNFTICVMCVCLGEGVKERSLT